MTRTNKAAALALAVLLAVPPAYALDRECSVDEGYGPHDCIYVYSIRSTGEWMEYECNDGGSGAHRVPNGTVDYQCDNFAN